MTNRGVSGPPTSRLLLVPRDPLTDNPACAAVIVCQRMSSGGNRGRVCELQPDARSINRYAPGAKLSPHQTKHEPDLRAPIISVSLGVLAVSVWRPASQRSAPAGSTGAWRYRGLGRRVLAVLSWYPPLKAGFHPMTVISLQSHLP